MPMPLPVNRATDCPKCPFVDGEGEVHANTSLERLRKMAPAWAAPSLRKGAPASSAPCLNARDVP